MGRVERSLVRMPLDLVEGYQQFHTEPVRDDAVKQDIVSEIGHEDVVDVWRQWKVCQRQAIGLDKRKRGKGMKGFLKIIDGNHVGVSVQLGRRYLTTSNRLLDRRFKIEKGCGVPGLGNPVIAFAVLRVRLGGFICGTLNA